MNEEPKATREGSGPRVCVVRTGAANLASVVAALRRAGAQPLVSSEPAELLRAEYAVLPGVGAFGPAMMRLAESGLDRALHARVRSGLPTLGICLGMQLFCEESEESPGIPGLRIVRGAVRRFGGSLPLPQLGWNRIESPGGDGGLLAPGWAYFANSYRLSEEPPGFRAWTAVYGERFVAALEGSEPHTSGLLLCQFHPELSGPWGLALIRRWLGMRAAPEAAPRAAEVSSHAVQTSSRDLAAASGALRVIPCLDIRDGRVVKGRHFEGLVDSGDPLELALRYEAEGADELALLDITATVEGRASALAVLRAIRAAIGIPIVMGGGIRSEADAAAAVEAGADRVSVNSAAVADPSLVERLAARFGVQCVVVAIDAARVTVQDPRGGLDSKPAWRVYVEAGRRATGLDPVIWAADCALRGAGEILLTSIDRDGTGRGYDLELLGAVAAASGLPVIASGGAAGGAEGLRHFDEAAAAGARGLLAAGAFHRGELRIGDIKRHLEERKRGVRTC
ncbi:MAG TPA: imidazole glycerol phosphate synthase subunit HisH [Rectinemataceae bacterium]|nr:imidazole glycerol phosphate synthase subunit HisH [Rectinemataceae bacterium]